MYWRPSVLWDVKQRKSVVSYRRFGTRLLKSLRGNDRPSQNVGNQLSTSAAHRPNIAKASSWYKYEGQAVIHSTFRNCVRWHFFTKLANILCLLDRALLWELKSKRPIWCHLLFYFTSYVLNMFRTLIYPSSGACDYSVELPRWSYCSWFDVCWRFIVVGLEWYPSWRL